MTALRATEEEARAVLADSCGQVGIAAVNSPRSVVISGDREAVDEVCAHFTRLGRRGRRLRISRAGHSPLMEPIRDELLVFAESLTWKPPTGPTVVSTLTGHPATGTDLVTPRTGQSTSAGPSGSATRCATRTTGAPGSSWRRAPATD
ncbi:acyltransferase domain-containing protein [Streptomyces sp. NPDC057575]|uniref:acyltransferase domain-containing protein n=1 Tax=unclassified Streptomyces TaxID=2593676 RepID=UPI0036ACD448